MFHYGLADELIKLAASGGPKRLSGAVKRFHRDMAFRNKNLAGERALLGLNRITPAGLAHHAQMKGGLGYVTKTGSIREVLRRLGKTIKEDPKDLGRIAKEMASGEGGQVAKGMVYGAGGYGALKGIPRKNPETKKREPFEGAGRGALKGMAIGIPLAALFRYPALRKALGVRTKT